MVSIEQVKLEVLELVLEQLVWLVKQTELMEQQLLAPMQFDY